MGSSEPTSTRIEYSGPALREEDTPTEPFSLFAKWFGEISSSIVQEPNAMALATVNSEGLPSVRMVLLKQFCADRGFQFFTNYQSKKGLELERQDQCALLFYWGPVFRQVRIEGSALRCSESENDEYFYSRPTGAQRAAVVSPQSTKVSGREDILAQYNSDKGVDEELTRPLHWGGYWVRPHYFEFWQGQENRLHDRLVYEKSEERWERYRLAP